MQVIIRLFLLLKTETMFVLYLSIFFWQQISSSILSFWEKRGVPHGGAPIAKQKEMSGKNVITVAKNCGLLTIFKNNHQRLLTEALKEHLTIAGALLNSHYYIQYLCQ